MLVGLRFERRLLLFVVACFGGMQILAGRF
jgi:hypothetical protein